jgi:flavin prenyltransferase
MGNEKMKKVVVGMTGASGVIYGIRLLQVLKERKIRTHLIITGTAKETISIETEYHLNEVEGLASEVHPVNDLGSSLSSGSFLTDGMVIVPCSIKTLSAVANSFNENLLIRAADVTLKERRKLILVVRETPLHKGHLELMRKVTDLGGIILPPIPAFYHAPRNIEDLINHTVGKILDLMEIDHSLYKRWEGRMGSKGRAK